MMGFSIPPERLVDGTTVFFTFTTPGYADFVRNLHRSLCRADPLLADKLVVVCSDAATAAALRSDGLFTLDGEADGLPAFAGFDGSGFGRVVSHKFRIARALLRDAPMVWWIDGDIVARGPLRERVMSRMRASDGDLLMQAEWPSRVINTGFWVARRTAAVEAMLADLTQYTTAADADDQAYFNARHATGGLTIELLDRDAFLCGNQFYYRRLRGVPECALLHFNYSVGRATKQALMAEHGCWYLDAPRSSRIRARLRHLAVALAARAGIRWADAGVGTDVPTVAQRMRAAARERMNRHDDRRQESPEPGGADGI
jgi:hypothetical protein